MAILQKLNSKANLRKTSGGDLPYQTSYPVIARYEADSTASQTLINMTFSVDQANKESFQLFIDGKLLREGSSNDFTFTSIQADNTSSQITLNAPIDANLNIVAIKLGLRVDSLSSGSSAVSSGGSKNYFSLSNANPDFEKNVTSPWLPCTLGWSGTAPSGAPTLTATNMTLSVSNSNPLIGSYSMLLTKAAANAQYQGLISGGLIIDREDVAKVLYGSFSYELVSSVPSTAVDFSGTSTQTYEIWIWNYDPANPSVGQWIQPAGYRGMNQSSGVGKVVFSFQTDGTFTNNAYKVAIITQQTGTGAIVVKFDDFLLGPQAIVLGTPVTDWVDESAFFGVTGDTSPTKYIYTKRQGDTLFVRGTVTIGSVDGSTFSINLPAKYKIDYSKITTTSLVQIVGNCTIEGNAVTAFTSATAGVTQIFTDGSNTGSVFATQYYGSQGLVKTAGTSLFNNGNRFSFIFELPIQGWSSNVQVSSDTDARVVAAGFRKTATQSITTASMTKVVYQSTDYDTHGAWDSTNNRYIIPVTGVYTVSASQTYASSVPDNRIALAKNGIIDKYIASVNVTGGVACIGGSVSIYCVAGEYLEIFTLQNSGGNVNLNVDTTRNFFQIARQSGPSVITATETVGMHYSNISGTLTTSTDSLVSFTNKDFDTHNAYSTSTGLFTAPVSGIYQVNAQICSTSATAVRSNGVMIYKGATAVYTRYYGLNTVSGGTNLDNSISGLIKCNAGETISIKVWDNGASPTVVVDNTRNHLSIVRVGN